MTKWVWFVCPNVVHDFVLHTQWETALLSPSYSLRQKWLNSSRLVESPISNDKLYLEFLSFYLMSVLVLAPPGESPMLPDVLLFGSMLPHSSLRQPPPHQDLEDFKNWNNPPVLSRQPQEGKEKSIKPFLPLYNCEYESLFLRQQLYFEKHFLIFFSHSYE